MTKIPVFRKHSIGAQIFAAFAVMGVLTAAVGGYGLYVLDSARKIVADTYDRPLMAINFARASSLSFMQMEKEQLRWHAMSADDRAEIDDKIEQLNSDLHDDLNVAEERSLGNSERKTIADIRELVAQWMAMRSAPGTAAGGGDAEEVLTEKIIDRFDVLTELTADSSFVEQRKAISVISYYTYASIGLIALSLLLAVTITFLLARRIIQPLSEAATIADRIATGDLQTPIPSGGKDETGALLRSMRVMQENIHNMMETETVLRRSAQGRLIEALESSGEGMLLVNADDTIAMVNTQVAAFFPTIARAIEPGGPFSVAFGLIQPLLTRRVDVDGPTSLRPVDQMYSTGEYELTDRRSIRVKRSNTHDGGFFLFLSDITEERAREAGLREATRQAEVAKEANLAKSRFLATMSHEIRTPMNGVLGMANLLAKTPLDQRQMRLIDNLRRSGDALLSLLNDVLDLSRIEAGKLDLIAIPFDVHEVVTDVVKMFSERCRAKNISLRYDIAADVTHRMMGDHARLRQILINLVGNAVKFTDHGRVDIALTRNSSAPTGDCLLQFAVIDTGMGIACEDQSRIFESFSQADGSPTRRFGGSGLGLAIAQQLTEMMGGQIGVESEPGRGSRFWFTARLGEIGADSPFNRPLDSLRVLLVHGDATGAESILAMLAGWHIDADLVQDHTLARIALRAGRAVDAVIVDAKTPEDFAFAKAIAAGPSSSKIIALSERGAVPERGTSPAPERLVYLVKPVAPSALYEQLAAIINRYTDPGRGVKRDAAAASHLGAQILVVEDNPVNQEVAIGTLEVFGVSVVTADNGQEAIALLERQSFDLILMDCEMPIMDGFETTRRIRALERQHGRRSCPIVAVTADVLAGTRERCLQAGMDDYISKPFTEDEMSAVLDRWVVGTSSGSSIPARRPELASSQVIDMSQIKAISALARRSTKSRGAPLLDRVIGKFAETAPDLVAQIRDSVKSGDADAVRRAAHNLKGSAANVGASEVSAKARDLETLGAAGTLDTAAPLVAGLETALTVAVDELSRIKASGT